MTAPTNSPPNWYPDPMGRHEYRWFDGANWTDSVSSHGVQSLDPVQAPPAPAAAATPADKVQTQVAKQAKLTVGAQ